jgi:hypothetical protein
VTKHVAAARANVSGAAFSERANALLRRVLPVGIRPPVSLAEQLEMGEVVIHNRFNRNEVCLH